MIGKLVLWASKIIKFTLLTQLVKGKNNCKGMQKNSVTECGGGGRQQSNPSSIFSHSQEKKSLFLFL